MFAEHSIAETAQQLTCLADSSVNFSVQGAITGYGAPRYLKCSTLASGLSSMVIVGEYDAGWWSTSVFPRLIVRPKSLDASEKRSSIRYRSCSTWATSAQSSAKRTSCRRVCRLFVFLWVDAGRRRSRPSGNECRPPSPDLGQHGTAHRWKRRWRGPGLVRSPASRRCWSRKHPSHCHWRRPS